MKIRDLQYLVAVAEHRHFGRAAAACFVSQPTLSAQLKKLETQLGVKLIERSPRQIMLTRAGEQVVQRARVILREVTTIERIAKGSDDAATGTVRIGLFHTLAPYLLPHVMPQISEQFPDLEVLLVEDKTEELLRQLRSGELDAAVLALPVPDGDLDHVQLFDEEFLLAVPVGHPLAESQAPIRPSELSGEDVLLLEDGHCLREQALAVCQLAGIPERSGFRATSLETLRHMVAAGVGVTLLPELAVRPPVAPSPGITLLRFAEPRPSRRIAMMWRQTSEETEFLTELAGAFGAVSPDLVRRPTD